MSARTGVFRRVDRLLRSREFQHVLRHGRRGAVRGFVVVAAPAAALHPGTAGCSPRLGVTVSRRVGNAVVRNRLKRRIREWFRRERAGLRRDLDLVVIGRSEAARLDSCELGVQLRQAAEHAGAWQA